ncbi:hypothetical protein [Puniceicoccus vermicola]|uniref:Uncharacterized protein n=1 Tax=Puniceicoccus vermicola TaxID=388746 RepID=A0A7X1E4P2_9BACT|nr:hypothetical protein [Puniceicoccus vermicola]MBC2602735.1 hypothetical protein [Puniceicoccus vermicola]
MRKFAFETWGRDSDPDPRRGFALITALGMMGLMLLLLVTLYTHLNVEVRTSRGDQSIRSARENTILSLSVALGHLQKFTGPDQAVSARSDLIKGDDPANDNLPDYWTGVWDESGAVQTWLVSGNEGDLPLEWNPVSGGITFAAGESAVLVTETEAGQGDEVVVPLQSILENGEDAGSFAFWVGDEGIKAKVNVVGRASQGAINEGLLYPQVFGIQEMRDLGWFDPEATKTRDLVGLEEVEQWATTFGQDEVLPLHFHNLSAHGHGVLADTVRGGLKKDLTAGLRPGAADGPSGSIFGPQLDDAPTLRDPGGPAWSQLESWVQASYATGNSLPVRASTDTSVGFFPVLAGFQNYLFPTFNPDGTVDMHMSPAVVLWNPYDRPLELTDYVIRAGRSSSLTLNAGLVDLADFFNNWYLRLQSGEDGDGDPVYEYLPGSGESGSFSPTRYEMRFTPEREPLVFRIPGVVLAPGESKVFSPDAGHEAYAFEGDPGSNDLVEGFRPGWSFYFPTGRTLNTDTDSGSQYRHYLTSIEQSRIQSIQLRRETSDEGEEVLADVLYLNYRFPGAIGAPAAEMRAKPSIPLAPAEAIGPRVLRTYVENDTDRPLVARVKWLGNHNPRASTMGADPLHFHTFSGSDLVRNPSVISMLESNADWQLIHERTDSRVPVGLSDFGVVENAVLFESSPGFDRLYSVGQLMQAPLYRWNPPGTVPTDTIDRLRLRNDHARFDNLIPAYAVGNSVADPRIPLDSSFVEWESFPPASAGSFVDFQGLHYDYSYLLNESLWDAYFFSTLPVTGTIVPANGRLVSSGVGNGAIIGGYYTSASELMIDGSFNVNSTSEEAWIALLSSFFGSDVELQSGVTDPAGGSPGVPVLRTEIPVGSAVDGAYSVEDEDAYDGYRKLSRDEIANLATAIVDEIELRGPFPSLAGFVNRQLDPGLGQGPQLKGALAAAIDAAGINDGLQDISVEAEPSGFAGFIAAAERGWRTEGIPGWLTQADLFARLGSVLSARSDTFRIRGMGVANKDLTEENAVKMWGELIVQRVPDFVDSANIPETPWDGNEAMVRGIPALNEVNEQFGRAYRVVGFRWLEEGEL